MTDQKKQLTSGQPVPEDDSHTRLRENGQQTDYVVLTREERAKGFVRPVRNVYAHKTCGTETRISLSIAETYARDPNFYGGTFCVKCKNHFPLDEFHWFGTDELVGS
jgi:hypothetical protein